MHHEVWQKLQQNVKKKIIKKQHLFIIKIVL